MKILYTQLKVPWQFKNTGLYDNKNFTFSVINLLTLEWKDKMLDAEGRQRSMPLFHLISQSSESKSTSLMSTSIWFLFVWKRMSVANLKCKPCLLNLYYCNKTNRISLRSYSAWLVKSKKLVQCILCNFCFTLFTSIDIYLHQHSGTEVNMQPTRGSFLVRALPSPMAESVIDARVPC